VVDPLGEKPTKVRSTQAGLVIVLRALPSVQRGDSLAVIMEMVTSALA
jgi:predicted deacylase